jgi:hypothetical protein
VRQKHRFEDQIAFSVFISRANLAKQNFYGIGPTSTLPGLAVCRQLQDIVGASVDWPILSWFAAGGTAQLLLPNIKGVSGTSTPSVGQRYGNLGAPWILNPAGVHERSGLSALAHPGETSSSLESRRSPHRL